MKNPAQPDTRTSDERIQDLENRLESMGHAISEINSLLVDMRAAIDGTAAERTGR